MNLGISIAIPAFFFFILDVVVIFASLKHSEKTYRYKAFLGFAILAAIQQGLVVVTFLQQYSIIHMNYKLVILLFSVLLSSMVLSTFFWFRYMVMIFAGINKEPFALHILHAIPAMAFFVICAISSQTGWIFFIDKTGHYHRGALGFITLVITYIYVFLAIGLVIRKSMTGEREIFVKMRRYVATFICTSLIGSFFQIAVFEGGYTQLCISLNLIIMFLEIYFDEIIEVRHLRDIEEVNVQLKHQKEELTEAVNKQKEQLKEITRLNNALGSNRLIVESAGIGIWGITFQNNGAPRMIADKKMKELLGVKNDISEEACYSFWYDRILPEALDSVNESVEEMRKGKFSENTYKWEHPEKGVIYVRCGGRLITQGEGVITLGGYHSEVDDIVKQEKAKMLELREAKLAAEEASKAKSDFLSNMSHDIRTPMNAILGFAQIMRRDYENNNLSLEKVNEYVNKIGLTGDYLLRLINNILEVAKIDSGNITVDEAFTDLYDENNNAARFLMDQMKEKNLTFNADMDIKHRYIYADMLKINEISMNLLSNAIKYTPNGGTIFLDFHEISCDKPGYARYENVISDNGIGMSKEFQSHLFEAFTREKNTTESKIVGSGLGMAIVKRLVDILGGTIEVESEPGKGTTFKVTMDHKIVEDPETFLEEQRKNKNESVSLEGRRILLAEDNDFNAEIAADVLIEMGAVVEIAEDGVVCIDMLEKSETGYYDVILMDIQMPNLNGYEATAGIRELSDEVKANIPIIAMTANAFEEDKKAAIDAGMNGFVSKPFKIKELTEVLQKAWE